MLLVYLAIIYAGCVLGVILELGRRLVLLDLCVQGLERRVYGLTRLGGVCDRLQRDYMAELMDIPELALVPNHGIDSIDVYEYALVPKDADISGLSSLNARDLYESLERSWDLIQAAEKVIQNVSGEGRREGKLRDAKLRRRNVVAVERDRDCTDE